MSLILSTGVRQKGVGLIEVLIAILILSIGAVGLVSLQIKAKRMSYESVQRSVATSLARDIIERMRQNPGQLAGYVVDDLGASSISSEPSPNCRTSICTPTELAAHDLWEWERALDGANETIDNGGTTTFAGGLTNPRACVTHNSGEISVAIVWEGFQEVSNPGANQCGEGLGLYGSGETKRQLVLITTFIDDL